MRVVSNWQEGVAEIGHSPHKGLVKILASSNEKTGVAHLSLEDAKLLRRALGRTIREIEHARAVEPAVVPITKKAAGKQSP